MRWRSAAGGTATAEVLEQKARGGTAHQGKLWERRCRMEKVISYRDMVIPACADDELAQAVVDEAIRNIQGRNIYSRTGECIEKPAKKLSASRIRRLEKTKKYAALGGIVEECCSALTKPISELQECMVKLNDLLKAVSEYEQVNL